MDRASIKQRAQEVLRSQKKPILQASALFVALILIFSFLSFRLTGPSEEEILRFTSFLKKIDSINSIFLFEKIFNIFSIEKYFFWVITWIVIPKLPK